MKIVFLSTFYPFRGGIAQFNALLYRAMEKNNEVKAFTFKRQYPGVLFPGQTQYVTENDEVDRIDAVRVLDTINPVTYLTTARRIKKEDPDLILTKYWMTFFAPSLGFVLGKMSKKTVRISILDNVIPHEKRFFDAFCNRYFLRRNDGFVVMSDKVLADLLSIRPDAKYLRIDHPVYDHFGEKLPVEEARRKLGMDEHRKTLLFFGIIRDYKGLDLLLHAFSELDDSYQLIISGEVYGSFEKYQEIIDRSPNRERIFVFNRYIADTEVSPFFSAADVCILPYKSATQSGITAISHHFAVPLIATDVGGLKETIRHGENGMIVERPDAGLIAASVRKYFSGDFKERFSVALEKEKAENSWESFASRVLRFARELSRK